MANIESNKNYRKHILGYPIDIVNQDMALNIINDYWQSNRELHVITLNAEMLISAQKDARLDSIIHQSNLVIPDGAGIVLALKLQGCQTPRLPGIELAKSALCLAASRNTPVALIGSSPEVLNYLRHSLPQEIPGLQLVYCQDGYFDPNRDASIMETINSSGARLVLVAMGVPRQEYFIEKAFNTNKHSVFIGVGGSFDIWAGKKQRAPKIWQRYHLEWLYRLTNEPWRFERMITTLPNFAWQAFREFIATKLPINRKK